MLCLCWVLVAGRITSAQPYSYKSFPNSLLWEVKGKGIEKPVYIFGTIHRICNKWVHWTPVIDSVFHTVDRVYFEVDVKKFHSLLYQPEGVREIDTMSFDLNRIVAEIEDDTYYCWEQIGFESIMYTKAVDADIHTAGLEAVASQLFLLNGVYDEEPEYQADRVTAMTNMYERLIKSYLYQNVNALFELTHIEMSFEQSKRILEDRNKRWVLKFRQIVKDKSVFIAVGAAHLGGEAGLLNLLQQKGYIVTPVNYSLTE